MIGDECVDEGPARGVADRVSWRAMISSARSGFQSRSRPAAAGCAKPSSARSSSPRKRPIEASSAGVCGFASARIAPGRYVSSRTKRPSASPMAAPALVGTRRGRGSAGARAASHPRASFWRSSTSRVSRRARDLQNEGAALGREREVLVALARQRARGRREPVQVPRQVDGILILEAAHRGAFVPVTVGVGEINAKSRSLISCAAMQTARGPRARRRGDSPALSGARARARGAPRRVLRRARRHAGAGRGRGRDVGLPAPPQRQHALGVPDERSRRTRRSRARAPALADFLERGRVGDRVRPEHDDADVPPLPRARPAVGARATRSS